MSESFAPKDIESLSKLAVLMVVPFLGAALFVDFGFWVMNFESTPCILSLFSSPIPWVKFLARTVAFIAGVGLVLVAYELINQFLVFPFPKISFFVGFSLLSFGALGIGQLAQPTAIGSVNIFWHLGALCWGLHIFAPPPKS
ncbi:hypothetical protein [Pseudothauera rhizosphaerae]|uniref:Uncharacterized protein n=1 Tax=Pseudothauera rhizosphaerae TaxID=2565932 RepID=A0A4S4AC30_9RHOO|nr:hypothetical protein [Pseudothauera rhizosphaerae]THF56584.1 hypothetical protein E6O51_19410 [Pseudothauera rhizosphaerae]